MTRSTIASLALLWAPILIGCSETADEAALSNSEAAAMVAEETGVTSAAFNAEGAPTVTFSVPNMMCEQSCVPTVRETLAAQPGAKEVKVELATKTATVAVEDGKFDPQAAVAALVDLQFSDTTIVTTGSKGAENVGAGRQDGSAARAADKAPQQPNS